MDVAPISYDGQPQTRAFWRRTLPHWDVYGRPIFLTLHVNGALPAAAAARIRAQATDIATRRDTDYTRRLKLVFRNMEQWLDRADQAPRLTTGGMPAMLRDAISERVVRKRWRVLEWTIMPSHLHLLYVGGTVGMRALVTDFKRWTGRLAAGMQEGAGIRFWQAEWFDHWSRSAEETERIVAYIRENPVRAGLARQWHEWPHRGP